MKMTLISWIGQHDLDAVTGVTPGPVFAAIEDATAKDAPFNRVHLLYNYPSDKVGPYLQWLLPKLPQGTELSSRQIRLSSPTAYAEIYPAVSAELEALEEKYPDFQRVVHLSPGTPAMAAIWILLVKTSFPAVCIQSWTDPQGRQIVQEVELPFEIDARFSLDATSRSDERLSRLHETEALADRAFSDIVSQGSLHDALNKARKMALRDVPVLLLGETGTGKELFARAIHEGSLRHQGPFVAVNCGALPRDLAESLLFGHRKGAFTGATRDHEGFFAQADGGTLFLDEVGELPPELQVKLLRVLQERSFIPVGASEPRSSDFRIVAATHRNLQAQVSQGGFREDLFYRLAIGVIKLPALRDRPDDLPALVEALMDSINRELADQPGYRRKKIDDGVINVIIGHDWPGNIRELRATLLRAAAWSEGDTLTVEEVRDAMLTVPGSGSGQFPDELSQPVDLNGLYDDIARHYISLALARTNGNKTQAARLLGLRSQQVLTNKMKKLGIG
jgi:transcriptional regulator with PAS, ATPase and Fis domain